MNLVFFSHLKLWFAVAIRWKFKWYNFLYEKCGLIRPLTPVVTVLCQHAPKTWHIMLAGIWQKKTSHFLQAVEPWAKINGLTEAVETCVTAVQLSSQWYVRVEVSTDVSTGRPGGHKKVPEQETRYEKHTSGHEKVSAAHF